MYNVHLTHSLLCFEFVEFTLVYLWLVAIAATQGLLVERFELQPKLSYIATPYLLKSDVSLYQI